MTLQLHILPKYLIVRQHSFQKFCKYRKMYYYYLCHTFVNMLIRPFPFLSLTQV